MIQEALEKVEEWPVGTVVNARRIGWKGTYLVLRVACTQCGVGRWVMKNRQPPTGLCLSCSGKRTVKAAVEGNRKPRPEQSIRQRGENNPSWKGGVVKGGSGYRYVLLQPSHPLYGMGAKTGHVMEHRLVMAEKIGRPLAKWEQVHHINGIRDDNRPENLELWKHSQPSGVRQKDYHCPGCRCMEGITHGE